MSIHKMITAFSCALLHLALPTLWAQEVPLGEVQIQEIFLEGVKEKLLGNHDKALERFQEVLQKDPGNDAAAYEQGRVYLLMEKDEDAIRLAKMAVELDPANIWYKLFLGDLYQKTDRNEDGAELYKVLSEKEPYNEEYALKRAFFLVRANRPEDALDVYNDLEKRIGVNEELTRRKHALHLGMGDQKKAARELENLVEAFPKVNRYRHLLATYYEQIGEDKKARSTYQEILEIDPDDPQARLALTQSGRSNHPDVAYLENLIPIFSDRNVDLDLKIRELIPFVLKVTETGAGPLADKALELAGILRETHPNKAKAWSVSGDLYYHSGQVLEARNVYEQTLELDDSVFAVWEQLLQALDELNEWKNLQERTEAALDLFPNQAILYYFAGRASFELGDYPRALEELNQAAFMTARIPSEHLNVLVQLGKTYSKMNQAARSDQAFDEALAISPADPLILASYAYELAERSTELEKAEQLAAKAAELGSGHPLVSDTYGWVLYQKGDFSGALEWIQKALDQSREDRPRLLEHMGDVLFRLDRVDEAVSYWEQALALPGSSPGLEKKITERKIAR